jgi:trehalose 6-phosphate phosphatase
MPAGSAHPAVRAPPAHLPADRWAVFLDLDGTLIEYAHEPGAVIVDAQLLELLRGLALHTGGATAVVSGREIATLDALLAPLRLPASGLHGFERRSAAGVLSRHAQPGARALAEARRLLASVAAQDERLRLEDKGFALALHYRMISSLEPAVLSGVREIAARVEDELELRRGFMVVELAPRGISKAIAVSEFMAEQPFRGRLPLFVGDDLTDEPAFEWVNAAGGASVVVNASRPTAALAQLPSVTEVRLWLQGLFAGREPSPWPPR